MSKKGKRLREFEKRNRSLTVREEKRASLLAFEDEKSRQRAEEAAEFAEPAEPAASEGRSAESPRKKKKKVVVNVRRLATIGVVFIFAVAIGLSAGKLISLKNEKDALEKEQQELTELKEELTAELEGVNSAAYIEQQVRKSLRLIKENEILFILPEEFAAEGASKESPAEEAPAEDNSAAAQTAEDTPGTAQTAEEGNADGQA